MLKNEKGFLYPATYVLLILASAILIIHLEQSLTERKMLTETTNLLRQEYSFLSALKQMEDFLKKDEHADGTGIFYFKDSNVRYTIRDWQPGILQITFLYNSKTQTNLRSYAYYDTSANKMISWGETQ
ncbi:hypothetical protein J9303_16870 [Bacillaceae bacterium Marseille-Q3522]|nr:hypothetical protein [Bacillaceae bacterium Marseille-Q3522]